MPDPIIQLNPVFQLYPTFKVTSPEVVVNVPEQPPLQAPVITNVVEVAPTPVTVENRVEPAAVHVVGGGDTLIEDGPAEFTFKRDQQGRIIGAKRKPTGR